MIVAAAVGSITTSGAIVPFLAASVLRNTGSFVLDANPSSISLAQGTSSVSTITITSLNGFSGTVSLSTMFTGGNLPVTLSSSAVLVPTNGKATAMLDVTVPGGTAAGSYGIVVVGASSTSRKTLSSSTDLLVQVVGPVEFAVSAQPYYVTEIAGTVNSTTIVVGSLNGFNGTVSLSATVPFGFLGVMGGANPVVLSAGGTASSALRVSSTASTLPGNYTITVTGTSGQQSHTCKIVVYVWDPPVESLVMTSYLFNSPTSLTLYLKNTGTTTVTLDWYSVKDFAGDAYTLANWAGPVIAPGSTVAVTVLIGSSCAACTYTWVIGLYTQFISGQTYTVELHTTMTNAFSFNAKY